LEFARWVLAPGKLVHDQVTSFWYRYLYFVGIRQQNDQLRQELDAAKDELSGLRENASEVERLRRLLSMTPPSEWTRQGARIISHRLGPNAALETFLIDKGSTSGVIVNTPVVSPEGVVGRVLRISPSAATILLITDPNSRIPVVSQKNRTQGILKGEGPNRELVLQYVPQGAPIEEGEILVTSGLEEIFPKGLPMARVTSIGRSGSSLFQLIYATPLFAPLQLEEVALIFKGTPVPQPVSALPAAADSAMTPVSPGASLAPGSKSGKHKTPAAIPPSPGQGAPVAPQPVPTPAAPQPAPTPAQPASPPAAKPGKHKAPAAAPAASTATPAPAPSVRSGDAASRGHGSATPADGTDTKKSRKSARPEGQ